MRMDYPAQHQQMGYHIPRHYQRGWHEVDWDESAPDHIYSIEFTAHF